MEVMESLDNMINFNTNGGLSHSLELQSREVSRAPSKNVSSFSYDLSKQEGAIYKRLSC